MAEQRELRAQTVGSNCGLNRRDSCDESSYHKRDDRSEYVSKALAWFELPEFELPLVELPYGVWRSLRLTADRAESPAGLRIGGVASDGFAKRRGRGAGVARHQEDVAAKDVHPG